jgi:hypothetical protein
MKANQITSEYLFVQQFELRVAAGQILQAVKVPSELQATLDAPNLDAAPNEACQPSCSRPAPRV